MSISIDEVHPGAWRWVFRNAAGAVTASSRLYNSAAECWHELVMMRLCQPVLQ
jgi:uncharacterized protein YegP (UPF0339 family)